MQAPPRICIFHKSEEFSSFCRTIEEKTYRHGTVFSWFPGGMKGALKAYGNKEIASLMIIEAPHSPDVMFEGIRAIQKQTKTLKNILLVGTIDSTEIYRQLMRQGIGEYVSLPIAMDTMMTLFHDLLARLSLLQEGKITSVIGVRGGTGASTLCQNMAWLSSSQEQVSQEKTNTKEQVSQKSSEAHTLLIDCERSYGSITSNLLKSTRHNHKQKSSPGGIQEACREWDRLDTNYLEQLCYHYDHLSILPSLPSTEEPVFSPRTLAPLVHVCQVRFRSVFLDIPHGWEPWQRYLIKSSYHVVLVGLPCIGSIQAFLNIIPMLEKEDIPYHIVINRTGEPHMLSRNDVMALLPKGKSLMFVPSASHIFHMAENMGTLAAQLEPSNPRWRDLAPLLPNAYLEQNTHTQASSQSSILPKWNFLHFFERWLPA